MFGFMFPRLSPGGMSSGLSTGEARTIAEDAVKHVEHRLEALELSCAGLWRLLRDKHGYTDSELIQAITEMDALDGNVDGKMSKAGRSCPHCGHKLLARSSPRCSWCGVELGPLAS